MSVIIRNFWLKVKNPNVQTWAKGKIYWKDTGVAHQMQRTEESWVPYGFFVFLQVAVILFSCKGFLSEQKGTWPQAVN